MPVTGQRGPQRQGEAVPAGFDPQMQALVDRYGIDALREMAKGHMQSGAAPTLSTSAPVNMPSLPAPKGARPAATRQGTGGGFRGAPKKGGGFVNPNGMKPGFDARANEARMREQFMGQVAAMKMAAAQTQPESATAATGPTQASTQPQSASAVTPSPVHTVPMSSPGQAMSHMQQRYAPAAQASTGPQPVDGLKLLFGVLGVVAVVGGGAYVASRMAKDEEPQRIRAKARSKY